MRKTMLGLVLAALMTAGLGSAAWAEPAPVVQYPASAVEAVAAGSDYTYEELLACLTGAGCTEAEALAYAGEPVEAPRICRCSAWYWRPWNMRPENLYPGRFWRCAVPWP